MIFIGTGCWTSSAFADTISTKRGYTADYITANAATMDTQAVYTSYGMQPHLNPKNVIRECCDSEEHPETVPVILALDVTGSMGPSARIAAGKLNEIMTSLFEKVKDVEFLPMAIGDLAYDSAPIQASQFESDARICDQMLDLYFEGGGGGNAFESYTGAWWFGLHHTKLDCWNRGKKGIIITLGDEPLNPYLPARGVRSAFGDEVQADVNTDELYEEVKEKFDIFHIAVTDKSSYQRYEDRIKSSFGKLLGQNFMTASCDELADVITDIVVTATTPYMSSDTGITVSEDGIAW